jgi:flagella basal body P-ring formation protein FlgA
MLTQLWPQMQHCLEQRYAINPTNVKVMPSNPRQLMRQLAWVSSHPLLTQCEAPWLANAALTQTTQAPTMAFFTFQHPQTPTQQQRVGLLLDTFYYSNQWKLTTAIPVGTVLSPNALQRQSGWFSASKQGDWLTLQDVALGRWQAKQALKAGTVLSPVHVKEVPLVQAHHPVSVEYTVASPSGGEPIRLRLQAEALSNACLHERLMVKQLGFMQRRLWVEVTGKQQARVVEH